MYPYPRLRTLDWGDLRVIHTLGEHMTSEKEQEGVSGWMACRAMGMVPRKERKVWK